MHGTQAQQKKIWKAGNHIYLPIYFKLSNALVVHKQCHTLLALHGLDTSTSNTQEYTCNRQFYYINVN